MNAFEHVPKDVLSWLFVGVFALLALQAAVGALFTRERGHTTLALLALTALGCQLSFTLAALPELSVYAQRALTVCCLLWAVSALICARALRPDPALPQRYERPSMGLVRVAFVSLACAGMAAASCALPWVERRLFVNVGPQLLGALGLLMIALHLAGRLGSLRSNIDVAKEELSGKVSFLEDALATATENTERAEQAARVKDEFMATMSHELRTPLNAIINLPPGLLRDFPLVYRASCPRCHALFELEEGDDPALQRACPNCAPCSFPARGTAKEGHHPATESLLVIQEHVRYAGTPESTLRYLEKIERSGSHLLQIVNGILDAEQVKTGQLALTFGETDMAELTREVIEEMSDLAERGGVQLALTNVPDGSRLVVDRLRLRQVLINLISNAIKFSDRRGTVFVSVEAASEGYRFAVRDQGIGIATENLETVFGSFEQVQQPGQRRFGGTGLGLFISRSLVRKHGGDMWVESTLGQGATFRFHIPRRERARSTANLRDSQLLSITTSRLLSSSSSS